jgi:glycosyltransferase involved in cell wall biosynthesis
MSSPRAGRIRVGVNLLWLLPGAAGGAERYAVRLLRALTDEASDDVDVTILCNRRFPPAHGDLTARAATAVAPIDGGSRAVRIAAESTWLAREASRRDLQLIHHPNDVLPWVRTRPSALTIHDLRSMAGDEVLGGPHAAYLRVRVPSSARAAAVVMTPSEYVRRQVLRRFRLDPARVIVVSAPVFPGEAPDTNGSGPPPVPGRYFVYPAVTDRHKNHPILIEAFARVAATDPDVRLVLTAVPGNAEPEVEASIRRLDLGDRVRRMGMVTDRDLDRLLASAVGLVYPSRFEGYGLPLAEAMALGCPVIASSATALPEVVGDAALVIGPDDVAGWTDAMLRLLDDETLRSRLVAAGRERVRSLSPAESARRLVAAYQLALEPV